MRQYIIDNENPVAIFEVKRANNQGFDLAYVVRDGTDYRLVITEAKSGAVGKLTAFWEGSRGLDQLQRNLENVTEQIEVAKLPRSIKEELRLQVLKKRFEVQLFMGEVSNLKVEHLDFLRQVTGKSVQNVVVLPHK